jgi:hypothetical protein
MKKLFSKSSTWDKPFSEKIAKRVSKIPTSELEMWVEQSIYEVGRCLSGYTKSREMVYLEEARTGAEALHAVVEELHKRHAKPYVDLSTLC